MVAPALLAGIPFLTGAAAGVLTPEGGLAAAHAGAGGAALALAGATGAALHDDLRAACGGIVLGCFLAGSTLGALDARRLYAPSLLAWFETSRPTDAVRLEGVLREDASPGAYGVTLIVDVERVHTREVAGGVRMTVGGTLGTERLHEWRAGRRIRAPATLRRPATYFDPGVRDDRPPLARRGIVLTGSVKSAALVEVVARGGWLREAAAGVRAWVRRTIAARTGAAGVRGAGVTAAILIGDRSGLAPEDERRLQEAGTYHVIAISGGNIAVLALLLLGGARVLMVPPRMATAGTAGALVLYGLIAAGAASVARAVTVAVLVLAGRTLDHRGAAINALAVAALLAVAWSPVVVLDAGFILSFGATLGILLGARHAGLGGARRGDLLAERTRRGVVAITGLTGATLCAEVALAPVTATLFSRVPLAGFVLNLAAIPLMTVVQLAGLLLMATASWWDLAAFAAARAAGTAATALLESARLVEHAPWLSVRVPPPAPWVAAIYYGAALALVHARARPVALGVLGLAAAVMVAGPGAATRGGIAAPRGPLRVVVLDVGQGDATAILLPDGRALLVDAGGTAAVMSPGTAGPSAAFDVGDRVVAPALRALGIRRLHAFVLTHGDPDHVQGAAGVLRQIQPAAVWEGVPVPRHPGLGALAALAAAGRIPWRTVQAGDRERFGPVEVRVLHPPLPDWERQRVRNEDSVVLDVRLGNVSIILPGDIGREGERALRRWIEPDRLVVLKAPHHGSATSSTPELLSILQPAAVIFSCGRDNRFGHPHPAVVERYRKMGAAIFSTAEHGAVFIDTDGRRVDISGWIGGRGTFE